MAYELDKDVPESFEFSIGGNSYLFKYPTTEDIEKVAAEKDEAKSAELMYQFITPVDPASPAIKDVMRKVNTKVINNFTQMVKTELGVE